MAYTCDNDNHYRDEQQAYNAGLLDGFAALSAQGKECTPNLSMGYYDGNTVTALWNYAQRFAMSDNFFASTFGTTVMGHLNLVAGQTHGAVPASIPNAVVNGSVIAKRQPRRGRLRDRRHGRDEQPDDRRSPDRARDFVGLVLQRMGRDRHPRRQGGVPRRLQPALRAVPVLRVDREPPSSAAVRRSVRSDRPTRPTISTISTISGAPPRREPCRR